MFDPAGLAAAEEDTGLDPSSLADAGLAGVTLRRAGEEGWLGEVALDEREGPEVGVSVPEISWGSISISRPGAETPFCVAARRVDDEGS